MTKLERFTETNTTYDLLPIVKARPLLTPPRTRQPNDPPMYALWCPHHRRVEVLSEEITHWPAMVQCGGMPVILTLGRAIFVGTQLLFPAKRDRLLQVLQQTYGDDVLVGSRRAWVETPGVSSDWQPASVETRELFKSAGLFGRSKPPVPSEPSAYPQPELVS
jgi:hypothetical protein